MDPRPRRTTYRDVLGGPGSCKTSTLLDFQDKTPHEGRLVTRVGTRLARSNQDLLNAVTGLPRQLRENWRLLSDPIQFRLLMRSLGDDSLLTKRRRKAILSILLWSSLVVWVSVGAVLWLLHREALVAYRAAGSLFFYSIATSMFLPTPFELLLRESVRHLGTVMTVLVASTAKTAGSWLVLVAGDRVNDSLQGLLQGKGMGARLFQWLMKSAQKWGYVAIFVIFAIPFMSDTAPLFVLAALRMRKMPFLVVTFAAIAIRSMAFLWFMA